MTTLPYDTAVEDALADLGPEPDVTPSGQTAPTVAPSRPRDDLDAPRTAVVEPRADGAGDRTSRATRALRPRTSAPGRRGTAPASSADETPALSGRTRLRLVPAGTPARRLEPTALPSVPPVLSTRVSLLVTVAHRDEEEERGDVPATDPGRFAHGVGLACVEVVLGRRPAAQLARWLAPEVLDGLQQRASLVRRAGVLAHARRPAARRVRLCPLDAHTAEACLVVDDGVRVRAVALRLEAHRGAWRVTTLEIG